MLILIVKPNVKKTMHKKRSKCQPSPLYVYGTLAHVELDFVSNTDIFAPVMPTCIYLSFVLNNNKTMCRITHKCSTSVNFVGDRSYGLLSPFILVLSLYLVMEPF